MLRVLLILCGLIVCQSVVGSTVRQPEGRIVGGKEVSIKKHPHQISIRYKACNTCAYAHNCGGSIFNANVIVTAAHCLYNKKADKFLIVSSTDIRNGADGAVTRVEKFEIHEDYNPSTIDNDVGVIFLSTPLPIDNFTAAAIPLADVQPEHDDKALITGWGTISSGGSPSNKLLEVEVPIVSNEICGRSYGANRITDRMLCAGLPEGGKDACQGDSGGPMVVNGELAGIVSWGRGCAQPNYPGVYTNVANMKSWILKTIATKK